MLPSWLPTLLTASAALAAVLAMILLAGRLARMGGFGPRRGGGRSLVVLETAALDSRRRVHVVACDGRRMLLLTGGASDVLLGWLDEPEAR